jgi:hypothetical protein
MPLEATGNDLTVRGPVQERALRVAAHCFWRQAANNAAHMLTNEQPQARLRKSIRSGSQVCVTKGKRRALQELTPGRLAAAAAAAVLQTAAQWSLP